MKTLIHCMIAYITYFNVVVRETNSLKVSSLCTHPISSCCELMLCSHETLPFHLLAESPISFTKPLEDVHAIEGDHVSLVCEVSAPHHPAEWFKDGVLILPSSVCSITQEGLKHALTMPSVLPEDEAEYVCKIAGKSTTATVLVDGRC